MDLQRIEESDGLAVTTHSLANTLMFRELVR